MANNIVISGSPHVQTDTTVNRMMYDVVIALTPVTLLSFWVFGLGSLTVTAAAIASAMAFEYLIQRFVMKVPTTLHDGSALLTGLFVALNVPAGFPIWMTILGSFIAIGVAKLSFGGLGNNIFNPALVARVFLLISFPVQMTKWPIPFESRLTLTDATTGATPLGYLKEAMREGNVNIQELMDTLPAYSDLFLGKMGGSIGEISAILLLIGGIYLLVRKVITWHIPVSILATIVVFGGIMWLVDPTQYADPLFHLITGGIMLGAFYMATDLVTSPMSNTGKLVFGVGIGLLTMVIRYFGAYPEGVSFAIIIMNAFVPLLDKYFKVKRFGDR
jgi:electron transport complex protein RnfD